VEQREQGIYIYIYIYIYIIKMGFFYIIIIPCGEGGREKENMGLIRA
jgi:hypothetical protein